MTFDKQQQKMKLRTEKHILETILVLIFVEFVTTENYPTIQIWQKTSLDQEKSVLISDERFAIPDNVDSIYFECTSNYPTKWVILPSPHRSGSSIKEWYIDKRRAVPYMDIQNISSYKFISRMGLKFTNNPNRILDQNAACRHVDNGLINVNISISTAEHAKLAGILIYGKKLTRMKKNGERYGKNKRCDLVMHFDSKNQRMFCEEVNNITTTLAPDFIECGNPDECDANVQQSNCTQFANYIPVKLTCDLAGCTPFGSKPGALICEYEGRVNSLAQIVFFTLDMKPYLYMDSRQETKLSQRLHIEVIGEPDIETNVFHGTKIKFRCSGALWYFSQGFQWALQINGDLISYLGPGEDMTTEGRSLYTSSIEITFPSVVGPTRIICLGPVLNSYVWENVSKTVNVKDSDKPMILRLSEVTIANGNEFQRVLQCDVDLNGNPILKISWKKNEVVLNYGWSEEILSGQILRSTLHDIGNGVKGEQQKYTCEATNSGGSIGREIYIKSEQGVRMNLGLQVCIPIVILVLLLLIGYLYWKIRVKNREIQKLSDDEIREFTDGNPNSQNSAFFYPYNTDFEISKSNIYFESKILGDGYFGRVTRGKIGKNYVAIKTVKKLADISYLKALLSEIKICCYVGHHENIVNLVGGCTQNIQKREVYVIYEYCANGNMLKYLRKYKDQFVNHLVLGRYKPLRQSCVDYQNMTVKKLSSKDLLRWCIEISTGMEFLNQKNIVHGDLAARNVLLTESLKAKVGDFGLSKQLYDYSIYVQSLECPLPLKWMAIESLRDLEFSIKSDVWSFGVTLWEIYSLAQIPYPGIHQWDSNSWKMLLDGYRMEKPQFASDELYEVMLQCWNADPDLRPTFSTLKTFFEGLHFLSNGNGVGSKC